MITSLNQLAANKTHSHADYLNWQFDERMELIKEKPFEMSSALSRKHQKIARLFHGQLYQFLNSKSCQPYFASFDVRLAPCKGDTSKKIPTVVHLGMCVCCDQSQLDGRGTPGTPDPIVEILAPGNSQTEMKKSLGFTRQTA